MHLASWNVRSLIVKLIELVKSLRRRMINITYVQETKGLFVFSILKELLTDRSRLK